jgi:SAM-dependent methyltransferase
MRLARSTVLWHSAGASACELRIQTLQRPNAPALCRSAPAAQFVQAAAERLPFESDSFHVVYSCYVMHEIPELLRDSVLAEMARVLKPGGTLVVTDPEQMGDRPLHDDMVANFEQVHEPFWVSYVERCNFGEKFKAAGLQPDLKVLQGVTKTLSAIKPCAA